VKIYPREKTVKRVKTPQDKLHDELSAHTTKALALQLKACAGKNKTRAILTLKRPELERVVVNVIGAFVAKRSDLEAQNVCPIDKALAKPSLKSMLA